MIHDVEVSLDKLAADIQAVDRAYTSTKARNYIGFSGSGMGLTEQIGLISSFICTVLILTAAFACVFLRLFLSDKEKEI